MNYQHGANRFLSIKVMPNARANRVVPVANSDGSVSYKVYVTTIPSEGKANAEAICVLADFMKLPKSTIKIVRGATSRNKVLEIMT